MNAATINEKKIYFEVFLTPEPIIVLSDKESLAYATNKVYSLHRFSIRYAMEDFVKYLDKVQEYKNEREKPTTPF